MMISKAWECSRVKFGSARYRWKVVRGHIAATLAVLLDLSWGPISHVFWRAGARELRIVDGRCPSALWGQLLDACSASSWLGNKSLAVIRVQGWKEGLTLRW
eukprot:125939-Pyramimonas_sp.AAC.1